VSVEARQVRRDPAAAKLKHTETPRGRCPSSVWVRARCVTQGRVRDMSSPYRDQVAAAVDAVRILSPTAYSWFGRRSQPLRPGRSARLDAQAAADCLTVALQHQLYADFYTLGGATPVTDSLAKPGPGPIEEHTRQLSRANCGTGYWDRGWTIVELPARGVVGAAKGGLRLRADIRDVKSKPNANAIGQSVALHYPKEEIATSPGYYI